MGLFANATTVAAPAKKSRKPEAEKIHIEGLTRLAAIDAAMKTLAALKAAEELNVKAKMAEHFIKDGLEKQRRPANFKGMETVQVDGKDATSSASCELKIRSSSSDLSEDDQLLLKDHQVPFGEIIKTPEAFLINPAYTNDMALLGKVEAALIEVDLPADFLLKQEEVKVMVATEDSIEAVFQKNSKIAEILLPVVTTMACKPTIDGDIWAMLDTIMTPRPPRPNRKPKRDSATLYPTKRVAEQEFNMGIRSLVEINHDSLYAIETAPDLFVTALSDAIQGRNASLMAFDASVVSARHSSDKYYISRDTWGFPARLPWEDFEKHREECVEKAKGLTQGRTRSRQELMTIITDLVDIIEHQLEIIEES